MNTSPEVPSRKTPVPNLFPDTHWSLVANAAAPDRERAAQALGRLCETYRQPIYRWLRCSGLSHHAAEDAVQDFVQHLFAKGGLTPLAPGGTRFRTYLLTCLRHRLYDQHDARMAAKRGGNVEHTDLAQLTISGPDPQWDRALDRDFALTIHHRALAAIEQTWSETGRKSRFEALRFFILKSPAEGDYAKAGVELGLNPRQVKRMVFDLREAYFSAFRAEVAQTVTPEEMPAEIAHLVAILAEDQ